MQILLLGGDDQPGFGLLYPFQILDLGIEYVSLGGVFPLTVKQGQVRRIQKRVQGDALARNRSDKYVAPGLIPGVQPGVISPYVAPQQGVVFPGVPAYQDGEGTGAKG